jgi:hypothetical protein
LQASQANWSNTHLPDSLRDTKPMNRSDGVSRRVFLAGGAALGAVKLSEQAGSCAELPAFELDEVTISSLQEGMAGGKYTAQSLTELYLRRIESIDGQGPAIHSVLETNSDALEIARKLDAERASGRVRGPLHGIPVLLTDNIARRTGWKRRQARWRCSAQSRPGTRRSQIG